MTNHRNTQSRLKILPIIAIRVGVCAASASRKEQLSPKKKERRNLQRTKATRNGTTPRARSEQSLAQRARILENRLARAKGPSFVRLSPALRCVRARVCDSCFTNFHKEKLWGMRPRAAPWLVDIIFFPRETPRPPLYIYICSGTGRAVLCGRSFWFKMSLIMRRCLLWRKRGFFRQASMGEECAFTSIS